MAPPQSPPPTGGLLERIDLRGRSHSIEDLRQLLPAPEMAEDEAATAAVRAILEEVRSGGDTALRAATERFDGVHIDGIRVPEDEVKAALGEISPDLRHALET